MERTYGKTNLFLIDKALWAWAKFKSAANNFTSVSEYVFDLIKKDKDPYSETITFTKEEGEAIANNTGVFMDKGIEGYLRDKWMIEEWIEEAKEETQ